MIRYDALSYIDKGIFNTKVFKESKWALFYLLQKGVKLMGDSLEDRVRNMEVRQAMMEQRMDTVATDVKEIKNTLTWLNRLTLGAVIAGILNLVLKVG